MRVSPLRHQKTFVDRIGRGTTLNSGIAIAYSTLDYILKHNKCKTLFATHYHELEDLLGKGTRTRKGVEYWCTDAHQEVSPPWCLWGLAQINLTCSFMLLRCHRTVILPIHTD